MSQIEVDKVIPQSGTALQVGESGDTITIPAGATITNNGTANGFGSADTEKVKVSSNDTTAGFLNGKLVAGTNISLTEGSDGGNETLTAALSGTIATAQIADDAVTLAKMAPGTDGNIISYDASGNPVAVATGSAGQILTSAGAGAPPTFATPAVGGITEADQWRITADSNQNTAGDITSNWERNDSAGATYIGTGLSQSSGIFSFPSTGKYLINFQFAIHMHGGDSNVELILKVTTNNSSYSNAVIGLAGNGGSSDNTRGSMANSHIFDVTNTTNCKFKFYTDGFSTTTRVVGDTNNQISGFWVIRLGDT